MKDKNPFGGGNPHGLYTPMSEDEQEVLERLVANNDLYVELVNWGRVDQIKVTFGDLKVKLEFRVFFQAPSIAVPVHYFDMELRTRSGILLFKERKAASVHGQPAMVGDGIGIDFTWWIAIREMSSTLVKAIKPGAHGLTSREGNRHLDSGKQAMLNAIRRAEDAAREEDKRQAEKATKRAQDDINQGKVQVTR